MYHGCLAFRSNSVTRTGQYNTMSAEVKEVDSDTLDKALGMGGLDIKDIGEKLLGR